METCIRATALSTRIAQAYKLRTGHPLPSPSIMAYHDGSIDIFWHEPSFELLIHIPPDVATPTGFYGDDYAQDSIKGTFDLDTIITWLANKPVDT